MSTKVRPAIAKGWDPQRYVMTVEFDGEAREVTGFAYYGMGSDTPPRAGDPMEVILSGDRIVGVRRQIDVPGESKG